MRLRVYTLDVPGGFILDADYVRQSPFGDYRFYKRRGKWFGRTLVARISWQLYESHRTVVEAAP